MVATGSLCIAHVGAKAAASPAPHQFPQSNGKDVCQVALDCRQYPPLMPRWQYEELQKSSITNDFDNHFFEGMIDQPRMRCFRSRLLLNSPEPETNEKYIVASGRYDGGIVNLMRGTIPDTLAIGAYLNRKIIFDWPILNRNWDIPWNWDIRSSSKSETKQIGTTSIDYR